MPISKNRYNAMVYNRCGKSGLKLPAISLGLWHNWGENDSFENARAMTLKAFDLGITHFDLANNYGPPPGTAEENFGRLLKNDLAGYRDELIISTKAGYDMWPGPYGNWGTRKHLIASLDQSLNRMGLEYVDIFYHHRPDPQTPIEETMTALDHIARSGKALYIGLSRYSPELTKQASKILNDLRTPCLIHQPRYSLFERDIEDNLLNVLENLGIGCIAFSPLAQGMLTDKYVNGIPPGSRAAGESPFLKPERITEEIKTKTAKLNQIALDRGQSLAQMSVVWILRQTAVTSVLIGASNPQQIEEIVDALEKTGFSTEELEKIDAVC
ncbi:L-glyceraldehyde 3-phosphate reductase [bacterium]|nr:L-glyceraldehyde 3-phosphate reductase [bacterium]